jgi:hypothetical protein
MATQKEIEVGHVWAAKVSGKITELQVVHIRERFRGQRSTLVFDCINLRTERHIVVRSAQRFRFRISPPPTQHRKVD